MLSKIVMWDKCMNLKTPQEHTLVIFHPKRKEKLLKWNEKWSKSFISQVCGIRRCSLGLLIIIFTMGFKNLVLFWVNCVSFFKIKMLYLMLSLRRLNNSKMSVQLVWKYSKKKRKNSSNPGFVYCKIRNIAKKGGISWHIFRKNIIFFSKIQKVRMPYGFKCFISVSKTLRYWIQILKTYINKS